MKTLILYLGMFFIISTCLSAQSLQLVKPSGGENLVSEEYYTILWNSADDDFDVDIYLWQSGSSDWTLIADDADNTGAYSWLVPEKSETTHFIMKIVNADNTAMFDKSKGFFHVVDESPLGKRTRNYAISATQFGDQLSIYPNPAIDAITAKLPAAGEYDIKIYDILGVLQGSHSVSGSEASINIERLAPGVYLMHASSVAGLHVGKFMVE